MENQSQETNGDAVRSIACPAFVGYCPKCGSWEPDYKTHKTCPDGGAWEIILWRTLAARQHEKISTMQDSMIPSDVVAFDCNEKTITVRIEAMPKGRLGEEWFIIPNVGAMPRRD